MVVDNREVIVLITSFRFDHYTKATICAHSALLYKKVGQFSSSEAFCVSINCQNNNTQQQQQKKTEKYFLVLSS